MVQLLITDMGILQHRTKSSVGVLIKDVHIRKHEQVYPEKKKTKLPLALCSASPKTEKIPEAGS